MAEKKTKYRFEEPAERPVSVALSPAELIELAKCHVRAANRLARQFAKASLECKTKRELNALHSQFAAWNEAHTKRAKGLYFLAEEHLEA